MAKSIREALTTACTKAGRSVVPAHKPVQNQTGSGKHAAKHDKYKGMPANRRRILEQMDNEEGGSLFRPVTVKVAKSLTPSNSLWRHENA